jgi:hypothetical protein
MLLSARNFSRWRRKKRALVGGSEERVAFEPESERTSLQHELSNLLLGINPERLQPAHPIDPRQSGQRTGLNRIPALPFPAAGLSLLPALRGRLPHALSLRRFQALREGPIVPKHASAESSDRARKLLGKRRLRRGARTVFSQSILDRASEDPRKPHEKPTRIEILRAREKSFFLYSGKNPRRSRIRDWRTPRRSPVSGRAPAFL